MTVTSSWDAKRFVLLRHPTRQLAQRRFTHRTRPSRGFGGGWASLRWIRPSSVRGSL